MFLPLRNSSKCCGSGSGIKNPVLFTPRIWDPGWSNGRIRIWDKQTKFVNSLYTDRSDPGSGIRCFFTPRIWDLDLGWSNSRVRIWDPG
jgi:hypothetical protein